MPTRKKIIGTNQYVDVADDGGFTVVPSEKQKNTVNLSSYHTRPAPTDAQMDTSKGASDMIRTGERVAAGLPTAMGMAAAPFGAPAEIGVAGATSYALNSLQDQLAERNPSVPRPANSPMESAMTDMVAEGIFGGIPRGIAKLKSGTMGQSVAKMASKVAKPNPAEALHPDDLKLLEGLGIETTAGQQGGNGFVKSLEKKFGGHAYEDIKKRQERGLQNHLTQLAGGDSSEVALQGVQKEWAGRLAQSRTEQRSAFQQLMRSKDPVSLDLTKAQAEAINRRLGESKDLRTPLSKEAKAILDGVSAANPKGAPSMDAVLDIEDRMHRFVSDPSNPERDRKIIESLQTNVDKDVRSKIGQNGSQWDTYQLARKEQTELFDGKEVGKILDSPYLEHSKVQKVLENPQSYDDARKASKNVKQFDAAVKESFLARIIEKSTDGTTFKLGQPIKEIAANKEAYGRFFSAAERNNIDQLMRTMERVAPEAVESGHASMSMAQKGGLLVAGSLLSSVLPGHLVGALGGAGAIGLGMQVGANSFVKNVLLNPTNAKIVAQLAKTPPNTQQAKILTNHLFLGMKGAQIMVSQPGGALKGWGTIDDRGKWQPNEDMREH